MGEPSVGAVLEFVEVALEAYCGGLSPKDRMAFLRRMGVGFELRDAGEVVTQLSGPRTPAMVRADRASAYTAFKDFLPRLMAP